MADSIIKYRWIIETLMALLLIAYGFIFNTVNGRISGVEAKFESLNPTLMQIQTDLSSIKADISWLRKLQTDGSFK